VYLSQENGGTRDCSIIAAEGTLARGSRSLFKDGNRYEKVPLNRSSVRDFCHNSTGERSGHF
jgi:hypothetical protein